MIIFAQYSLGMGICLNLDITRAAALDLLTFDLSFLHGLFLIMFDSSGFITYATESFTAWIKLLATLDLRYTNLDSMGVLFVSKLPVKVVSGLGWGLGLVLQ